MSLVTATVVVKSGVNVDGGLCGMRTKTRVRKEMDAILADCDSTEGSRLMVPEIAKDSTLHMPLMILGRANI